MNVNYLWFLELFCAYCLRNWISNFKLLPVVQTVILDLTYGKSRGLYFPKFCKNLRDSVKVRVWWWEMTTGEGNFLSRHPSVHWDKTQATLETPVLFTPSFKSPWRRTYKPMDIWKNDACMRIGFRVERKDFFSNQKSHSLCRASRGLQKGVNCCCLGKCEPAQVNFSPESHLLWATNTLAPLWLEFNTAAWKPHSAGLRMWAWGQKSVWTGVSSVCQFIWAWGLLCKAEASMRDLIGPGALWRQNLMVMWDPVSLSSAGWETLNRLQIG